MHLFRSYQAFKIAVSIDINHAESLNNLGVLELRKHNPEAARSNFEVRSVILPVIVTCLVLLLMFGGEGGGGRRVRVVGSLNSRFVLCMSRVHIQSRNSTSSPSSTRRSWHSSSEIFSRRSSK